MEMVSLSSFFLNWPFFVNILLNPSSTENGLSYGAAFHRKWPVSVKQSTEPVCATAKSNGYKFRNANKGKKEAVKFQIHFANVK